MIQDAVPLSAETALRLERAGGIPANVLTQADAVNQANKQRSRSHKVFATHRDWFARFPKHVLAQLGAVTPTASIESGVGELLVDPAVADPGAYDAVYGEVALSFRRSQRWDCGPQRNVLVVAQCGTQGRRTRCQFI